MTPSSITAEAAQPGAPVRVAFVGAGPGDPGLMTVRARAYLAEAAIVVTDQLTDTRATAGWLRSDAQVIDAGHGDHGEELTAASRVKLVVRAARNLAPGGLLVRLMDGDPAYFTGIVEEAAGLTKAGIGFEIVPGVSAISAVPSYAGIPLTAKGAGAVHIISTSELRIDWAPCTGAQTTVVVLGTPEKLPSALADLLAAGRDRSTPVALTTRGTTTDQATIVATLGEVVDGLVPVPDFPSLAVLGPTVTLRESLSWFETKPLFGWQVLVPRTKDQAGGTVERLGQHGATATVVPTIGVEPPRTPQQLERSVKGLVTGRYEWIGFTSVNAVRAIREKFVEFGLDARAFAGLKIAAVGGVTAAALRDWGIEPDLVPSGDQSAAGLLEDWPPFDELLDPVGRVFLPRADIATETLVAGLIELGWEVDDVTAYRTVRAAPPAAEIRDAIKSGGFDAVVFTSSSTVRNLVGIAGKPHPSTVIACIGPATAKTAEEQGLRVDVLAPEASSDALVDALAAHGKCLAFAAREAGSPVLRPSQQRPAPRRRAR